MPTVRVGSGSTQELQDIADAIGKSRKVVVITGAGISTNCGIPVSCVRNIACAFIDVTVGFSLRKWPLLHDSSSV